MLVSGSSALPKEVLEFLQVCSLAKVYFGYGQTELCAHAICSASGQKFNSYNQLGYAVR